METNATPIKNSQPLNIAVIGGGISGIVSAYVLSRRHAVTLIEAAPYLGGHTNTFTVKDGPDAGTKVDTGFIVCNPVNYQNFYPFLRQLAVPLQNTEMSFGFHNLESGFSYNGPTIKEFLVEPKNILQKNFLRMLYEQRRFNRCALMDLKQGTIGTQTLGDYFKKIGVSTFFINHYIVPLAAAIWSSPDADISSFPAATFIRFFNNHGMLDFSRLPQWQTVVGGSCTYVEAFKKSFPGTVRLSSPVISIRRTPSDVIVSSSPNNTEEHFDAVVLATHANQALALLADPSNQEQQLLGTWKYHTNRTVLHTDDSILPKKRKLWAAWNYVRNANSTAGSPVAVTYYMNKLQRLTVKRDYLVTLNDISQIDEQKILYEIDYTHPVYTNDSIGSQQKIRALNGTNRTYFCGAYLGYGFHEDGAVSALEVARHFGMSL